jgi:hypothetical protein
MVEGPLSWLTVPSPLRAATGDVGALTVAATGGVGCPNSARPRFTWGCGGIHTARRGPAAPLYIKRTSIRLLKMYPAICSTSRVGAHKGHGSVPGTAAVSLALVVVMT